MIFCIQLLRAKCGVQTRWFLVVVVVVAVVAAAVAVTAVGLIDLLDVLCLGVYCDLLVIFLNLKTLLQKLKTPSSPWGKVHGHLELSS